MTQDTKAAQITAALEAIKLLEDMYSMELAEPEAMASLKAALKSPLQPAPEVVEIVEGLENEIAATQAAYENDDLIFKATHRAARNWLHLQRQRGGV